MKTLIGDEAVELIRYQFEGHQGCIAQSLARFDPLSTFETWFERYRAILALYARANRTLDRYYARALAKERKREGLLTRELGIADIKHWVISRFPIVSDNAAVIPFNQISLAADRCRS